MSLEPTDVVVQIDGVEHLRSLSPVTHSSIRGWVVGVVGSDTWERAVTITIQLNGTIRISRYTVAEDGGYVIDAETGAAAQDELVVQAPSFFPVHLIGIIKPGSPGTTDPSP